MTDMRAFVDAVMREGAELRTMMSSAARAADVVRACEIVVESLRSGGKLLSFGNGGSAADAQHVAAELVGRLTVDRRPLPAVALTVDSSALTSIANDYGWEFVFERQLRALGNRGDEALAITTSGKSPSVLRAVRAAKELGVRTVGLTGAKGEDFARACDVGIVVPSNDTARIQEIHITIGHVLCAAAEAALCGVPLLSRSREKQVTLDELLAIRGALRAENRTVVWTNGCFDILHAGHVESLQRARALGDVLVVGVNDDAYVRRTKGEGRPIHVLAQRVALLSALEMVDFVLPFSETTPERILAELQPEIHCKGMDYAPPHGAPIPEADVVKAYGGRIEFLPIVEGLSTTAIARRLSE